MKQQKILADKEFMHYAKPILENPEFQKRKEFLHHKDSVYDHSLAVSYRAYKMAKSLQKISHVSVENVIIAGLLHDFYTTPWRDLPKTTFTKKHGFTHGKVAKENAFYYFGTHMNQRISNSIEHHMFPLVLPPRYLEGWILTFADKIQSASVLRDYKEWLLFLGFHKPKK